MEARHGRHEGASDYGSSAHDECLHLCGCTVVGAPSGSTSKDITIPGRHVFNAALFGGSNASADAGYPHFCTSPAPMNTAFASTEIPGMGYPFSNFPAHPVASGPLGVGITYPGPSGPFAPVNPNFTGNSLANTHPELSASDPTAMADLASPTWAGLFGHLEEPECSEGNLVASGSL